MTAREMARDAVANFLNESGHCACLGLANDSSTNQPAYDMAWDNFMDYNTEEIPIPEFCIVEEWVHHFLRFGDV